MTTSRARPPAPPAVRGARAACVPWQPLSPGCRPAGKLPSRSRTRPRPPATPSASMPPAGSTIVRGGKTVRRARSMAGLVAPAGNNVSASAPAARIASPSAGVKNPGIASNPGCLAARVTATSACGITISLPPATAVSATCSGVITVPAPTSILSPAVRASRAMPSRGSAAFSGTSTIARPAASRAAVIAATSSGCTPRKIGITGQLASQPFSPTRHAPQ